MQSLLYISESKIEPTESEGELKCILATANAFNPTVGITGALLYTGAHFAQIIEGDEAAVSRLYESIARDFRHDKVRIMKRGTLTKRRFPDWSMAYNGPSQFVSRNVMRLFNEPSEASRSRAADWLAELLQEFSGIKGMSPRR